MPVYRVEFTQSDTPARSNSAVQGGVTCSAPTHQLTLRGLTMMNDKHRIKFVVWVGSTLEGLRVVQGAAPRSLARLSGPVKKLAVFPELAHLGALNLRIEIGILLPNNQHQHRTLRVQKDVLPHALC